MVPKTETATQGIQGTFTVSDGTSPTNYALQANFISTPTLATALLFLNEKTVGIPNIVLALIVVLGIAFFAVGKWK